MRSSQKKKKGKSVQELVGIKTFMDYGLQTNSGELLFYLVTPTNISVLSASSIENKIRQLMLLLTALPDIEITCTDSCEYLDDNKEKEENPKVKKLMQKDVLFLDGIQTEMATSRQFLFVARCRNLNPSQVFERENGI